MAGRFSGAGGHLPIRHGVGGFTTKVIDSKKCRVDGRITYTDTENTGLITFVKDEDVQHSQKMTPINRAYRTKLYSEAASDSSDDEGPAFCFLNYYDSDKA